MMVEIKLVNIYENFPMNSENGSAPINASELIVSFPTLSAFCLLLVQAKQRQTKMSIGMIFRIEYYFIVVAVKGTLFFLGGFMFIILSSTNGSSTTAQESE
jgi:presenilin-like A22 family membrane protease